MTKQAALPDIKDFTSDEHGFLREGLSIAFNDWSDNTEELTEWQWNVEFCAMARKRLERLQRDKGKLSLIEIYDEANDAILEMFTYFAGLSPVTQHRVARDMKDTLQIAMAIKERARKAWDRRNA